MSIISCKAKLNDGCHDATRAKSEKFTHILGYQIWAVTSGLLNSLESENKLVGESVDHMRSQWISYSVRKHEQQMVKVL